MRDENSCTTKIVINFQFEPYYFQSTRLFLVICSKLTGIMDVRSTVSYYRPLTQTISQIGRIKTIHYVFITAEENFEYVAIKNDVRVGTLR